jgi:hypothetical protein
MSARHSTFVIIAIILFAAPGRPDARIAINQPQKAADLQTLDPPPATDVIVLELADDWGMVSIDPKLLISVQSSGPGADQSCIVIWRDGQAIVRGNVRTTRNRLGLTPAQ